LVSTRHGRPYALIRPIRGADLAQVEWEWRVIASRRLSKAWEPDNDRFYDYLS